jgi:hypothetical protein
MAVRMNVFMGVLPLNVTGSTMGRMKRHSALSHYFAVLPGIAAHEKQRPHRSDPAGIFIMRGQFGSYGPT